MAICLVHVCFPIGGQAPYAHLPVVHATSQHPEGAQHTAAAHLVRADGPHHLTACSLPKAFLVPPRTQLHNDRLSLPSKYPPHPPVPYTSQVVSKYLLNACFLNQKVLLPLNIIWKKQDKKLYVYLMTRISKGASEKCCKETHNTIYLT